MRYWHHIDRWESVPGGLYAEASPNGMSADDSRSAYAEFLGNTTRFRAAIDRVVKEWPIACEQFLSNPSINRIAWLGQASMCLDSRVPCKYRSGFALLDRNAQTQANALAEQALAAWLKDRMRSCQHDHATPKPKRGIHSKIEWYIRFWKDRGYPHGIPEEVPAEVARKQYAPSWKAIAVAILGNDVTLQALGFSGPYSEYYSILKQKEFADRAR